MSMSSGNENKFTMGPSIMLQIGRKSVWIICALLGQGGGGHHIFSGGHHIFNYFCSFMFIFKKNSYIFLDRKLMMFPFVSH